MTFKAATWNVFHDTTREVLEPILAELVADGVSIFLVQEATHRSVRQMFADHGLTVVFNPSEFVVAYDPKVWTGVREIPHRLSPTTYFTATGHPRHADAASVILSDRVGRTLTALSYHLPSSVQQRDPSPVRMQALREAIESLKAIAARSKTRALLFGGDDNVDEFKGFLDRFRFMRSAATGLRLVQAPEPTHAGGRRIDDFRVRGLRPGAGYVRKGGGDHKVHVRAFTWLPL